MKKLILNTLVLATLASPFKSTFAEVTSKTYTGKSSIALTYHGLGWSDSYYCNDSEQKMTIYFAGLIVTAGIWPAVHTIQCLESLAPKAGTFKTKLEAVVNEIGNDRVSVSLSSQDKKGCTGFNDAFIGEGDGFGSYELFRSNDDYVAGKSIGRLMKAGKEIILDIEPGKSWTRGKGGQFCEWQMDRGLHVKMKD